MRKNIATFWNQKLKKFEKMLGQSDGAPLNVFIVLKIPNKIQFLNFHVKRECAMIFKL